MQAPTKTADWIKLTLAYQKPQAWKSWGQVFTSVPPFILLWTLAYLALQQSFWLMLPAALLASLFLVRIFIIQHDCGHGSFLKNKLWRDRIGAWCSFLTMVPYEEWAYKHASHHAHLGQEEYLWTELGEIELITVEEYLRRSRFKRILYRLYRNPIFLFLIGPPLHFIFQNRYPHPKLKDRKNLSWSVWRINLALFLGLGGLMFWLDWASVLVVHLTILYVATVLAAWIFYVQHQFEDRYVEEAQKWDHAQASIYGSSFFKLPKILQWFTGNIGFHHVHHLSPNIPNYELERCHKDNPVFQQEICTFTLLNCWETMRLRFWDKTQKKMITWPEMKALYLK